MMLDSPQEIPNNYFIAESVYASSVYHTIYHALFSIMKTYNNFSLPRFQKLKYRSDFLTRTWVQTQTFQPGSLNQPLFKIYVQGKIVSR